MQDMQDQMTEGKTLWRGGEALTLQKIDDRFTIQLSNFAVGLLSHLAQELVASSIAVKSVKLVPFAQLAELRVEAHHLETAMQIARSNPAIAFASHVYQMEKSPDALLYLTDQITLQFAEEVNADRIEKIAIALGLQVLKLVPGVVKGFVFRVMPQATANPLKLAERLMRSELSSMVWLAEPNVVTAMRSFQRSSFSPEDLGDRTTREDLPLDLEAVWQITQGDRSTVIAVMDEAIDLNHDDFGGEGKIVAPFRLRQSLPHLSRLLAQVVTDKRSVPERNRLEIAPKCALMPIEMDGFLDDQSIEAMFEWAAQQGADVIFCDWRAANYFPLSLRQRMAIARVATHGRAGKGCVTVFSTSVAKDTLSETYTLNGFAVHPDVIAVAADSMKPIAAEVAALLLSVNPDLTAEEVKQILRETADSADTQPNLLSECSQVNVIAALRMAQKQIRRSLVAQWIELQNLQPIEIPDAQVARSQVDRSQVAQSQVASSTIRVEGDRSAPDIALEIEVTVNLEHSFASDLQIYLTAPNSETVLLQNRSLGRLGSLSKTYSLKTTPLLKRLLYQSVRGEWRLQLSDRVPSDTGRLVSWTLRLGV